MQSDAKHQQDNAQFRQLRCKFGICDKTRRKGSCQHAR